MKYTEGQYLSKIKELYRIIDRLETNWKELKDFINNNCFYDFDTITYEEIITKMDQIENK